MFPALQTLSVPNAGVELVRSLTAKFGRSGNPLGALVSEQPARTALAANQAAARRSMGLKAHAFAQRLRSVCFGDKDYRFIRDRSSAARQHIPRSCKPSCDECPAVEVHCTRRIAPRVGTVFDTNRGRIELLIWVTNDAQNSGPKKGPNQRSTLGD
jgi:hypothetical protein